jgi:hypothetical protein
MAMSIGSDRLRVDIPHAPLAPRRMREPAERSKAAKHCAMDSRLMPFPLSCDVSLSRSVA